MAEKPLTINRAPVLTLWASVVAERLGYDPDASLTLGKTVAGLNAYSKGKRLGIYGERKGEQGEAAEPEKPDWVELCGRQVPTRRTAEGLRAVAKDKPVDPRSVERYLEGKFGDDLSRAREAFSDLAAAFAPEELAEKAYGLYERFRPSIPPGKRGWGAAGSLDLDLVRSLAH